MLYWLFPRERNYRWEPLRHSFYVLNCLILEDDYFYDGDHLLQRRNGQMLLILPPKTASTAQPSSVFPSLLCRPIWEQMSVPFLCFCSLLRHQSICNAWSTWSLFLRNHTLGGGIWKTRSVFRNENYSQGVQPANWGVLNSVKKKKRGRSDIATCFCA